MTDFIANTFNEPEAPSPSTCDNVAWLDRALGKALTGLLQATPEQEMDIRLYYGTVIGIQRAAIRASIDETRLTDPAFADVLEAAYADLLKDETE